MIPFFVCPIEYISGAKNGHSKKVFQRAGNKFWPKGLPNGAVVAQWGAAVWPQWPEICSVTSPPSF